MATNYKLQRRWRSIKDRCEYAGHNSYARYGGRGIVICDEWRDRSAPFQKWALENGYSPELQLDRIDSNGPYSPDNCRFVDRATNNRNRRNTRHLVLDGVRMPVAVAAELHGIPYSKLLMRLLLGYPPEVAVMPTVHPRDRTSPPADCITRRRAKEKNAA